MPITPSAHRVVSLSLPLAAALIGAVCGVACHGPQPEPTPPTAAEPAAPASELSPALRAAYIAAVQAEAGAEYEVRGSAAQLLADNPAQGLRTSLSPTGVRIVTADDRRLELSLLGLGCGSGAAPQPPAVPRARGNRVEYARADVTEWYINGRLGIEQGFTVPRRPRCLGDEGLRIEVGIGDGVTATLHGSGDSATSYVELRERGGGRWLRYSDVFAQDARGRSLPVTLSVVAGRIRLDVDDAAAEYPITVDPLVWTLQQQVLGSDTAASDFFGRSLAMSGSTAVIGAWQATVAGKSSAGAAYVFVRSGSAWVEQAKLTASDAAADDAFGYAVALSGDTAVIGAVGAKVSGKANAGAAYVFLRSGTTWSQQQKLTASDAAADDSFGESVAVDGDTALVGASYANLLWEADAGAAYVFVRSGTTWSQQQKLAASDGVSGDHGGQAVALSGNTAAIGAPFADVSGKSSAGAAYVFLRSGTTWSQQQKLTASDAAATDGFGGAVALATDTLVVGASSADVAGKADAGAAYVFVRSGTMWSQQQKLTAATPAARDAFGTAVALSGSNALIGADGTGGAAVGGAAYMFSRSGTNWSQLQAFVSPLFGADGNFGRSVTLDGDYALIGAPYSNLAGKSLAGLAVAFALGMTKGNGQACVGGVECTSGFCADGVCCNVACGGTVADCQACSTAAGAATDGTCATAKAGASCRAAAGPCDQAESCDGTSGACPTDSFKPNTTSCRAAAGLCDVAEFCTGSAAGCPADNLKPMGAECRAAIGACDVAEKCGGTSIDCPVDSFKPNTAECRTAAGICDVSEYCTGTGAACPSDSFKAATTPCRAAAGACDVAESCTGTGADCPTDSFKPATAECRTAAGPCDIGETCTGTGVDCPTDKFKPNTSECRTAADLCDTPEYCSGTDVACPTDKFKPAAAECRSAAGPCDVSEYCTGGSPTCPTNAFKPAATECRTAAGVCDTGESCTGTSAACPEDGYKSNGTACGGGSCQAGACRPEADLSLSMTARLNVIHGQEPAVFQITVTNPTSNPATGIKVHVEVPKAATVQSSSGDNWTCQAVDGGSNCERPQLGIGAAPTLTVIVVPPKLDASFTVTASVAASEFDPNPANNTASTTITNEAPIGEGGGCAMAVARTPASPAGLALLLAAAALLRRRRARPLL